MGSRGAARRETQREKERERESEKKKQNQLSLKNGSAEGPHVFVYNKNQVNSQINWADYTAVSF